MQLFHIKRWYSFASLFTPTLGENIIFICCIKASFILSGKHSLLFVFWFYFCCCFCFLQKFRKIESWGIIDSDQPKESMKILSNYLIIRELHVYTSAVVGPGCWACDTANHISMLPIRSSK